MSCCSKWQQYLIASGAGGAGGAGGAAAVLFNFWNFSAARGPRHRPARLRGSSEGGRGNVYIKTHLFLSFPYACPEPVSVK